MIKVLNKHDVLCDEIAGTESHCDPLGLYTISQECGNCPLLSMAEEYLEIKFDNCF